MAGDKEIRVSISINDYPFDKLTPAMWEMWIIGKLKEAGIPIKGTLVFDGLERGEIFRLDDPADFGRITYIWRDIPRQQYERRMR